MTIFRKNDEVTIKAPLIENKWKMSNDDKQSFDYWRY